MLSLLKNEIHNNVTQLVGAFLEGRASDAQNKYSGEYFLPSFVTAKTNEAREIWNCCEEDVKANFADGLRMELCDVDDYIVEGEESMCDKLLEFLMITPEVPDIYEWWTVSDFAADWLRSAGETVVEFFGMGVWGRTCTGQMLGDDDIIQRLFRAL